MSNIGAGGALEHDAGHGRQQGAGADVEGPKSRTAKVGEPVALAAIATDDGKPNKRNMPARARRRLHRCRQTANGLRLSFFVYRGPGTAVTFDPPQTEGLGGHARRRRLAVVGGLRDAAGPGRQQVAGARDVRRARHLRRSARSRTTAGSGLVAGHHRHRDEVQPSPSILASCRRPPPAPRSSFSAPPLSWSAPTRASSIRCSRLSPPNFTCEGERGPDSLGLRAALRLLSAVLRTARRSRRQGQGDDLCDDAVFARHGGLRGGADLWTFILLRSSPVSSPRR